MRKLLMASAAILGATSGLALAEKAPAAPTQGQYIGPYGAGPAANNNNNIWGTANTPTGSAAAGGFSTIYAPNVDAVPAPGTIVVRLNGRVETGIAVNYQTGMGYGGYKYNPVSIPTFMRLYPGFDGKAANGLRYGAAIELRENFSATTTTGVANLGGSASSNSSQQTVYVRRSFVYFGADNVGIIRLGQADGVIGIFDPCIFSSLCWAPTGGILGDELQSTGLGTANIPFVWLSGEGAEYANSKVVYLSPQVYGFDFAAEYDPNMGNGQNGGGVCGVGSLVCEELTSGPGADQARWDNKFVVGLRYMHNFGAYDFKAYGTYTRARHLINTALAVQTYDDVSFGNAGAAFTAYGFTLAANWIGGAVNEQLVARPKGGAPMDALLVGLSYKNGPMAMGINWGNITEQGSAALAGISQRHYTEISAGASYGLAPGFAVLAEYMYQAKHQGGVNFYGGTGKTGDVHSNGFLLATVLSW